MRLTQSGAKFSPCRRWRYLLWRQWDERRPVANFLMLNPSTADEVKLDPSCTRARLYAERWGFGGLIVTNLFGWRATDPDDMKAAPASTIQCTPIVVDGVMNLTTPGLKLVALRAASGQKLWEFDPFPGERARGTNRGVTYWSDGRERRIFFGAMSSAGESVSGADDPEQAAANVETAIGFILAGFRALAESGVELPAGEVLAPTTSSRT